jgi:hypothetical protein
MTFDEAHRLVWEWLRGQYNAEEIQVEVSVRDHTQDGDDWLFEVVDLVEDTQTTVRVMAGGEVDWESMRL